MIVGEKVLRLSLLLVSVLIATSCSPANPTAPVSTPVATTTAQPSPTLTPVATPTPMSRPPEIKAFLQSWESISDINPSEFVAATQAVNEGFIQVFHETYYLSHQNLVDYYKPHDVYKLQQALASLVNLTDWQYKEDYFDCSEMTALTEYALEAAGFETLIISSLDPTGTGDPTVTTGHAWCVVVIKTTSGSQLIPVEATSPGYPQIPQQGKKSAYKAKGKTGYQSYDEYVTKGWVLDTIYEAFRYVPQDFDWWNSAQINRGWFNTTR